MVSLYAQVLRVWVYVKVVVKVYIYRKFLRTREKKAFVVQNIHIVSKAVCVYKRRERQLK